MTQVPSASRLLPVAVLIATIFFAKFAVYAWQVTPLWDIPDEPGHYSYALDLSRGEWPLLGKARMDEEVTHSWINPQAVPPNNWIAQHPPLFYALDAPIVMAARAADLEFERQVRSARLLSSLFGALTVLGLALFLARATGRDELGLAGAIFLAATPMFTHLSTGVSHDVLVACTAAWAAYWCVRWLQSDCFRHLMYAGALVAACTVTKVTGLAMAVPLFFAVALRLWHVRRSTDHAWSWLYRSGVLWLVMFGPICLWIVRNLVLFSRMFPDSANIHGAGETVPIGFVEFMIQQPVWQHTTLNFVALIGWTGAGNAELNWIQANGATARYFLAFLGAGALGVLLAPMLARRQLRVEEWASATIELRIRQGIAALAAATIVYAAFRWPLPHMTERTCVLLGAAFILTLAINFRGVLLGKPEHWLLATAAACTLVFALLYFEHLRGNFTGPMRATHGRYFYPVVPFMLLILLWPFRGTLMRRIILCGAIGAMLFADGFFLHQVFNLYRQLPA